MSDRAPTDRMDPADVLAYARACDRVHVRAARLVAARAAVAAEESAGAVERERVVEIHRRLAAAYGAFVGVDDDGTIHREAPRGD